MAFDYPHLGAAGVVADQYLPKAEGEGELDRFIPQAEIIGNGISSSRIFDKALGCLRANYVSDIVFLNLYLRSPNNPLENEPGFCRFTTAAKKNTGSPRTGSCAWPPSTETSTAKARVWRRRSTPSTAWRGSWKGSCSSIGRRWMTCATRSSPDAMALKEVCKWLNCGVLLSVLVSRFDFWCCWTLIGNFDVLQHIKANDGCEKKVNSAVYASILMIAMWRLLL